MKFKTLCLVSLLLIFALVLTACGGAQSSSGGTGSDTPQLVEDKKAKEIIVPAQVNGKYFTESTSHAVAFKEGSNGEKAIFRGLISEKDFHQALIDLGATPGNNVTMADLDAGVSVEGSKLNVFITWDGLGKEIPFADVIKASEERPMDIRFAGNLEAAKEYNSGCILCLVSCPVGITSDASYPTGSAKTIQFYGDESVLPPDGTNVSVIFRLAE